MFVLTTSFVFFLMLLFCLRQCNNRRGDACFFMLSYFSFLVALCICRTFVATETEAEKEENISSSVRFERLLLVYELVHCLNYVIEPIKYDLRQYLNE